MKYRRLGRTGLNVSVLSLGSGGPNSFGQSRYAPRKNILQLVRHALKLGINFFDTASAYQQSESMLGEALREVPRDSYYLASKIFPVHGSTVLSAAEIRRTVEKSLRKLGIEELDILQLHRVSLEFYEETLDRLMPELERLRSEGKIRYIGITESSERDPHHRMLRRALQDNLFDTVMVAYHLANTTAEDEVLPLALANDVGVIGMVAVRHLVTRSRAERLKLFSRNLAGLVTSPPAADKLKLRFWGVLSTLQRSRVKKAIPITRPCAAAPLVLPSAGYTFATTHPAVATVLTGTNDPAHLVQNLAAALAPALTLDEIKRLRALLD